MVLNEFDIKYLKKKTNQRWRHHRPTRRSTTPWWSFCTHWLSRCWCPSYHNQILGIVFLWIKHSTWIRNPQGHTIPRSYRLMFPYTKNTTKYESLIISINMVWKITKLQVYRDSHLVINQVNDDYQRKDDKMMPYKRMIDYFKKYFFEIKFE